MVRKLQGKILNIIQIGIYKNLCNSKSNDFHHLIKAGKFTKDELAFGMNLRSYKNTT